MLLPEGVLVGTIAVLVAGCVILSDIPEEKVPKWLKDTKIKVTEIVDHPIIIVDAIGQGLMDGIQSPEGIASVTGKVTGFLGGAIVGGYFGEQVVKPFLSEKWGELKAWYKGRKLRASKGKVGGSTTLNDWINKTLQLSKQAPIEIPPNATVKLQVKNGYEQITFKWTEGGKHYEVRWHTKTPGAPKGQGNTWVVSRVMPGTSTGQVRIEEILVGDAWIPRYQWQDAINAYRSGTATKEQLQLLEDGHWQAP